jgi:quercetin 2,3-dioxygenase
VEGQVISDYHAVDVESAFDLAIKNGNTTSKFLVLQGRPINEPVVQHGPFVMNSRQEIQQAFADYQQTQFGGWPWSRYDVVHDRTKGRFAKYVDGKTEVKG